VNRASDRHLIRTVATLGTLALVALAAGAAPPPEPTVTAKDRAAIVDSVVKGLTETYVFPEVAEKMATTLRQRLAAGAYEASATLPAFCQMLTQDLQSVSHDKHLRVMWTPRPPAADGQQPSAEEEQARYLAELRRDNYCFQKVEHLPGNVGYLKLDCFAEAEHGGATAVAAMSFLAGSDALIFDLREKGGGEPSMIQLISSYLFEEPKHLNSFYIRKGDRTEQFWTQAFVQGPRLADVPVFVLTSAYTFSGAEEFTYNLKNMKRATIVGETTGGGAHPVQPYQVEGHDVTVSLPYGRAVNPISGTNWEGTGVSPDIATPAAAALDTAYVKALEAVAARATDDEAKQSLAWTREGLAARLQPFAVAETALHSYAGTFGPRVITLEGGALKYQRQGRPKVTLVPMAQDLFVAPDLGYFRIRFERGPGGEVARLVGLYPDGRSDTSERSAE
jgi:hypothetical protein